MKRSVSILLILMLVFNSAGYVLMYFQLKFFFKKEAFGKLENYVDSDELTVIKMTRQDYYDKAGNLQVTGDNEITYFGKFYDISSIKANGDSVEIVCLSDENESRLDEVFELFFSLNIMDKFSKGASSNIIKSLITDANIPNEFNGGLSWREDKCFNFIFVPVLKIFYDVPTPPPKCYS
ncbi:MAG: hypothetical protein LWX07_01175 [Bacteroidetes bacterium]|nr:hypothetical protein [Bacteroidota bacterium]